MPVHTGCYTLCRRIREASRRLFPYLFQGAPPVLEGAPRRGVYRSYVLILSDAAAVSCPATNEKFVELAISNAAEPPIVRSKVGLCCSPFWVLRLDLDLGSQHLDLLDAG